MPYMFPKAINFVPDRIVDERLRSQPKDRQGIMAIERLADY